MISVLSEERALIQALQLGRTAEELRQAGDLPKAMATYQTAYGILPTSLLLWPMAELHLSLRQPVSGLLLLNKYVDEVGPPPSPAVDQTQDVEALRIRLLQQVSRVTIRTDEPGAQVLVDDRPPMERTIQLDPGDHHIEARGPRTVAREVHLRPGESLVLDLAVRPPPPPQRWRLSRARAITAGVLGGVLAATLGTAIALTALNGHDYGGGTCSYNGAQYGACVYYFVPAFGLGYGVSALVAGGLALDLFYPTRTRRRNDVQ